MASQIADVNNAVEMADKNEFAIAILETFPDGRRFFRSVKSPKHGWFAGAETETLADGRQFIRLANSSENCFVVEQRTMDGLQQTVAIGLIQKAR